MQLHVGACVLKVYGFSWVQVFTVYIVQSDLSLALPCVTDPFVFEHI